MIIGILHKGSGAGDQLFSYIATRVRAIDLGVPFGFVGQEFFKGKDFMSLDWGEKVNIPIHIEENTGRVIPMNDWPVYDINKPYFDPDFMFIPDNSMINGYGGQDERYWGHRLNEIREWLKVEPLKLDNSCVINFRGGEYKAVSSLFLTKDYWQKAIELKKQQGVTEFQVHTDDLDASYEMFKDLGIWKDKVYNFSGIETNWRSIFSAKHLIISNSAFAILPALLNENVKEVIAPRYWAGRNVSEWRRPQNYYSKFTYI